jgi:hypothetical protein
MGNPKLIIENSRQKSSFGREFPSARPLPALKGTRFASLGQHRPLDIAQAALLLFVPHNNWADYGNLYHGVRRSIFMGIKNVGRIARPFAFILAPIAMHAVAVVALPVLAVAGAVALVGAAVVTPDEETSEDKS